jgi:hypothetical protein
MASFTLTIDGKPKTVLVDPLSLSTIVIPYQPIPPVAKVPSQARSRNRRNYKERPLGAVEKPRQQAQKPTRSCPRERDRPPSPRMWRTPSRHRQPKKHYRRKKCRNRRHDKINSTQRLQPQDPPKVRLRRALQRSLLPALIATKKIKGFQWISAKQRFEMPVSESLPHMTFRIGGKDSKFGLDVSVDTCARQ